MKRKFSIALLTLLAAICLCFALVGCDGWERESGGNFNFGQGVDGDHVHAFGGYVYNNDATCTEDGTETATCSCGARDTRTREHSALGHNFKTYISNGDATCLKDGTETSTCTRCREKDTREEVGSALGHDFRIQGEAKAATCSEAGHSAGMECGRCHVLDLSAEDYTPALHVQYSLADDGYTVMGLSYDCTHKDIVIPETYMGKPVTSIAAQAFMEYNWITSIILPDTLTSIGEKAFYGCIELTGMDIPNGVTEIGEQTFYGCKKLTGVAIPDSVTAIGGGAFEGCNLLENAAIPDSVTEIGARAFYGCSSLAGAMFTEKSQMTSIGESAFYNCAKISSVTIPAKVTEIGEKAFQGCSSLEGIDVAQGNVSYSSRDGILYNRAMTKFLHIPKGLKGSVSIPARITEIEERAFENCKSLEGILFEGESALTSIGDFAFSNCISLESIRIPSGVTSIGPSAFTSCSALESITVAEGNTHYSSRDGILYDKAMTSFVHVPTAIEGAVTIPDSMTMIDSYAFKGCSLLTSVVIPESVKKIGKRIFDGCASLERVTMPFNTGDPFAYYFGSLSSQGTVGVPVVNNLLDYEYRYDIEYGDMPASLKEITVTGNMIPNFAFGGCKTLAKITIGSQVSTIGSCAFYDCNSLTSITIPQNVTEIGTAPFGGDCSSLTSISVSQGNSVYYSNGNCVIETGSATLIAGCKTSRIRTDGWVAAIGDHAFYNCTALESIVIPYSVTEIGFESFYGCTGLKSASFATPNGWYGYKESSVFPIYNFSADELSSPTSAAEFLTKYAQCTWKRY